jgi:hypothetical protein
MSGSPVLQRLADQTGHRDDTTAKATSRPWRYLIVQPCLLALDPLQVLRLNALPLRYIGGRKPHGARAHHYYMNRKFLNLWGAFSLLKSKSSNSPWPSGGRASNTENNPAGASIMVKASAIDVREFARFILSGVTATIGNMVAVWLARRFLSFEIALLAGIATAITQYHSRFRSFSRSARVRGTVRSAKRRDS